MTEMMVLRKRQFIEHEDKLYFMGNMNEWYEPELVITEKEYNIIVSFLLDICEEADKNNNHRLNKAIDILCNEVEKYDDYYNEDSEIDGNDTTVSNEGSQRQDQVSKKG